MSSSTQISPDTSSTLPRQRQCFAGVKRVNGFNQGFSFLQIVSYLVYMSSLTVFAICVSPFFNTQKQILAGLLYYLSLGIMGVLAIAASYSDPTDPVIFTQKQAQRESQEHDVSAYEYFCNICEAHVQEKSKHCRPCNRCVNQFDHHCQWLNNCIGQENYKLFFALIIAVLVNSIIYCAFLSVSLHETYSLSQNHETFRGYSSSQYTAMKVVVWIWLIAVAILGVFDFNLLMFHTWLKWKNLSTFEYISNSRIAKSVEIMINSDNKTKRSKKKKSRCIACCCDCFLRRNKNFQQITPFSASGESSKSEGDRQEEGEVTPLAQQIIQGMIDRSVCNSADVQEDDLCTEIGKQEAKLKIINNNGRDNNDNGQRDIDNINEQNQEINAERNKERVKGQEHVLQISEQQQKQQSFLSQSKQPKKYPFQSSSPLDSIGTRKGNKGFDINEPQIDLEQQSLEIKDSTKNYINSIQQENVTQLQFQQEQQEQQQVEMQSGCNVYWDNQQENTSLNQKNIRNKNDFKQEKQQEEQIQYQGSTENDTGAFKSLKMMELTEKQQHKTVFHQHPQQQITKQQELRTQQYESIDEQQLLKQSKRLTEESNHKLIQAAQMGSQVDLANKYQIIFVKFCYIQ